MLFLIRIQQIISVTQTYYFDKTSNTGSFKSMKRLLECVSQIKITSNSLIFEHTNELIKEAKINRKLLHNTLNFCSVFSRVNELKFYEINNKCHAFIGKRNELFVIKNKCIGVSCNKQKNTLEFMLVNLNTNKEEKVDNFLSLIDNPISIKHCKQGKETADDLLVGMFKTFIGEKIKYMNEKPPIHAPKKSNFYKKATIYTLIILGTVLMLGVLYIGFYLLKFKSHIIRLNRTTEDSILDEELNNTLTTNNCITK